VVDTVIQRRIASIRSSSWARATRRRGCAPWSSTRQTLIFDRKPVAGQISAIVKTPTSRSSTARSSSSTSSPPARQTRDGKLQVELAQLNTAAAPRAEDDALSRLTAGIGGRGPGETKLEIGRRRAKETRDPTSKHSEDAGQTATAAKAPAWPRRHPDRGHRRLHERRARARPHTMTTPTTGRGQAVRDARHRSRAPSVFPKRGGRSSPTRSVSSATPKDSSRHSARRRRDGRCRFVRTSSTRAIRPSKNTSRPPRSSWPSSISMPSRALVYNRSISHLGRRGRIAAPPKHGARCSFRRSVANDPGAARSDRRVWPTAGPKARTVSRARASAFCRSGAYPARRRGPATEHALTTTTKCGKTRRRPLSERRRRRRPRELEPPMSFFIGAMCRPRRSLRSTSCMHFRDGASAGQGRSGDGRAVPGIAVSLHALRARLRVRPRKARSEVSASGPRPRAGEFLAMRCVSLHVLSR